MVQIKLSIAFTLAAAAIVPVVAQPIVQAPHHVTSDKVETSNELVVTPKTMFKGPPLNSDPGSKVHMHEGYNGERHIPGTIHKDHMHKGHMHEAYKGERRMHEGKVRKPQGRMVRDHKYESRLTEGSPKLESKSLP
jgi:hypothetical protein